ncbi:MAG: hypothetical protein ACXAEU_22905 [Candidatus Hodarchaeales archaeon]|jgi:hypothetical protein
MTEEYNELERTKSFMRMCEKVVETEEIALTDFEEEHAEIIDEYKRLTAKLGTAIQELEILVRRNKIPAWNMKPVVVKKRIFKEDLLYDLLNFNPEIRDKIIKTTYKVNLQELDKAIEENPKLKEIEKVSLIEIKETVQIRREKK